jgi:hypothetical protein
MRLVQSQSAAQHRVHRTSAGVRPHLRDSGPNGGFGVWWLYPPNPALAGNACRWALLINNHLEGVSFMSDDKLAALKAAQDSLDLRKDKLLEHFVPFREQLIQELELFIENALDNDLNSVSKLKRVKDGKELKEIEFGLNTMDIGLISNNNVLFQNVMTEDLAAKIFVYDRGDENNTPLLEITFVEHGNNEYKILAQWFSSNGPRFMGENTSLSDDSAKNMASILVNHFYRFLFSWKEKPTMKAALGIGAKGSMGFLKE